MIIIVVYIKVYCIIPEAVWSNHGQVVVI